MKANFIEIAAVFARKLQDYPSDPVRTACLYDVARSMCDTFKRDNPRFNRDTFLAACGFIVED